MPLCRGARFLLPLPFNLLVLPFVRRIRFQQCPESPLHPIDDEVENALEAEYNNAVQTEAVEMDNDNSKDADGEFVYDEFFPINDMLRYEVAEASTYGLLNNFRLV